MAQQLVEMFNHTSETAPFGVRRTLDKVSPGTRSWTMSRVRSKHTSPEITTRKTLHAAGYRFRLHRSDLPGKPDIVLPRYRVVVMVHGCLWHGHGCKRFRWPVANADYWRAKIGRNVEEIG